MVDTEQVVESMKAAAEAPPAPPECIRVRVKVRNVSMAVMKCKCGKDHYTMDVGMVAAARKRGQEFPPAVCTCGRLLIGFTPNLYGT